MSFNAYSQISCDTVINKTDLKKLIYLSKECDTQITDYQKIIQKLETTLIYQQQRIKFLEELVINRERFKLEKCPRLSKKSKKKPKFRKI